LVTAPSSKEAKPHLDATIKPAVSNHIDPI
jgi:hypothetical protein